MVTNSVTVVLFYNLEVKNTLPFLYLQLNSNFGPNLGLEFRFGISLIWWTRTPRRHHARCGAGQQQLGKFGKVIFFEAKYFRWNSQSENTFR